jgi:hypothetical protein
MAARKFKGFMPLVILFVALNGFFIAGRQLLEKWRVDGNVLIVGNLILAFISWISFTMAKRALDNPNPNVFVRAVYGSFMIKFFGCAVAAAVYIALYKKNLNKPALFACMGLFLVYSFMEVSALTRLMKQKKNG